ncbi:MAG: hypothetical protein K2N44_10055 [Lachnospiraceae bacterium]|nr:hypothetical protein [Lachnospiraceae bacterium]
MVKIPLIIPEVPSQFRQKFRIRNRKGDICKAGFAFQFCCNCKAQKDIKRDMVVVPALVVNCTGKEFCEPMSFIPVRIAL